MTQPKTPHELTAPSELGGRLLHWYEANKATHPWRTLWEQHRNPYTVWVSEVMLQQTTLAVVLKKYESFLAIFPTVEDLALAPEALVKEAISGLGYYRRFRNLHLAAQQIVAQGRGLPTSYEGWLALPGIGKYTAAAISSIALELPIPSIDGNVLRVFARLLNLALRADDLELLKKTTQSALEMMLPTVSSHSPGDFNQALMELGQKICRPSSPQCPICPVSNGCKAFLNGQENDVPKPKLRQATIDVKLALSIHAKNNLIGLTHRGPHSKFLKNTFGFAFSNKPKHEIGSFTHHITNHKIRVSVGVENQSPQKNIEWIPADQVASRLISNLDQKAWKIYLNEVS